ncbi:peptidoglycan editing factor PgeF [Heliobacterium gestii]|uniref:Purine nucleoside phosphorylase n=1 Tax=Heliomicrobium gestii TaxID=2699 RepID=A0A845LM09_HELGE|nr:peptidoglycan editing factor PgeF [Heliomicrobium gestii]MBM7867546.1 YfiH family protein [Heliomicrobium gestii]MZP43906.1 peptidoglycan editing factor PgeF [Heliomicrobium gestii]
MAESTRWEQIDDGTLSYYRFGWPAGAVHAFSTRRGGFSDPPYDGLNVALHVGDEPGRVKQNRQALSRSLGLPEGDWVCVNQVHSDRIVWVGPGEDIDGAIPATPIDADALATEAAGVPLAVFGADCGLLLFYDPQARRIGAVHAGWRGTVAGLPKKMVEAFVARGSRPGDIRVAIGPQIGPCCYPVGDDVAAAFGERWAFAEAVLGPRDSEGKRALHLALAQRLQLVMSGIEEAHIGELGRCTSCTDTLFSYRRDKGRTGRQAALIMLKASGQS